MTYSITGQELGLDGCTFETAGDTPAEVVRTVVAHVQEKHDMDLPPADAILGDEPLGVILVTKPASAVAPGKGLAVSSEDMYYDEGAALVVRRLRQHLNLEPKAPAT